MLHSVMNETKTISSQENQPRLSNIAAGWAGQLAGPAVILFSSGLIIGLALIGIGVMGISAITWLFSGAGWFCGISLLTGGMFLATATALSLSQLSRARDIIYENLKQQQKPQTT